MKIAIYGIGAFGFAITKHLSENLKRNPNYSLFAYDRNPKLMKKLRRSRKHLYHHPKVKVNKKVNFVSSPQELIDQADVLILAVTSSSIPEVMKQCQKFINKDIVIVNLAKALYYKTGQRFSQVVEQILEKSSFKHSYAALGGGTIAADLFQQEPLGIDIASKDKKTLRILSRIFTSDNLNVYTTTDLPGVEYAGAFKNVISILAGIICGMGFSYGSETHFITRAAHEIALFLQKKAKVSPLTFSIQSQCWGNDLWLSCTGNTRNRQYGMLIGKGNSPQQALKIMGKKHKTVEGINTIRILKKLLPNKRQYPIMQGIYEIVIQGRKPKPIIQELMSSNRM